MHLAGLAQRRQVARRQQRGDPVSRKQLDIALAPHGERVENSPLAGRGGRLREAAIAGHELLELLEQ